MRYENILQTIGNTPVIRLNRLAPAGVNVYVKVEAFNPGGSVKDRMARAVIEEAERTGALKPGQTVVEATSGNTGIALAMVCAQKGYPLVVTMAENFSVERRKLMRFLGARVVLTPAAEKGTGMLAKAVELAETHGWFLCRQFENEANADVHSRTTAREILDDFAEDGLDYWVTGFGTGGTLKGTARTLKAESPGTRIVVCEPDNAPVLASGIAQPRDASGQIAGSHPMFRPHLMQGWSPDFIPRLTEDAREQGLIDEFQPIDGADALETARRLAREEGIFVGITSGATLAGALELAKRVPRGQQHPLHADRHRGALPEHAVVRRGRRGDERGGTRSVALDAQLPLRRACSAGTRAQQPRPALPALDAEAQRFVARSLPIADEPVVMFALEWCEFCWSVRQLFARLGIGYRSVDLDSVDYQEDDRGGKIRAVVRDLTGAMTIPQIFVGGKPIGGCTEVFDAFKSGALQAELKRAGAGFDEEAEFDPYSLLPTWLHPRKRA